MYHHTPVEVGWIIKLQATERLRCPIDSTLLQTACIFFTSSGRSRPTQLLCIFPCCALCSSNTLFIFLLQLVHSLIDQSLFIIVYSLSLRSDKESLLAVSLLTDAAQPECSQYFLFLFRMSSICIFLKILYIGYAVHHSFLNGVFQLLAPANFQNFAVHFEM